MIPMRVRVGWALGIAAAFGVAWRCGGSADARVPLPAPSQEAHHDLPPAATAKLEDTAAYQVTSRLIEMLSDAKIDAPSARTAEPLFAAHARKTRSPWSGAKGEGARYATTVALAAEGSAAVLPTLPPTWNPEKAPWLAGEGTFDQREAIYAPTPSTFAFHVRVPLGGKLVFTPGTMNRTTDAVLFGVTAVDAKGAAHDLLTRRVAPASERRWQNEESVDLAAFAGETIELRLRTITAPATHEELVAVAGLVPHAHGAKPAAAAAGGAAPAPAKPAAKPAADRALAVPSPIGLALWGDPVVLGRGETTAPYDVLWIVADGVPPDLAGMPALDALAARGVRFADARPAATWSRPATIAMLAGARSSELGVDPSRWPVGGEVDRFYASAPPLLPLLLQQHGVVTRAFVGDVFLAPYLPVGVDVGFERVHDVIAHNRPRAIAEEASGWLKAHADQRFFLYCELGKDDIAIGALAAAIDAAGLRDRTVVVVTSDRADSARVPLVLVTPPAVALAPRVESARVRTIDLAPTLLDLEAIDATSARAKMTGRSLLALARGEPEADERPAIVEGHGARTLFAAGHRLVVHDGGGPDELFELAPDAGEPKDIAKDHPDLVAEMHARLDAAIANVPVAGTQAAVAPTSGPGAVVHMRFAGGGAVHRVSGRIVVRSGRVSVVGAGVGPEAYKVDGAVAEIALTTSPDAPVGLDLHLDPASAALAWELTIDDAPWPTDRVYAGPLGLASIKLAAGLSTDDARAAADARALPWIDPARDYGLFVTREPAH